MTFRPKWLFYRNYVVQMAILVLHTGAQFLNDQFYLEQKRGVLSVFFDEPPTDSGPLFWSRWVGNLSRWMWGRFGSMFPFGQFNEVRSRGLALSVAMATVLRNRFYLTDEARRVRTRRVVRIALLAACVAVFFVLLRMAFASLDFSPLVWLAAAVVIVLLPNLNSIRQAKRKELDS